MKKLIIFMLSTLSLCAMDKQIKPFKRKAEPEQISRQTFQDCKDNLPISLKDLIADIRNWSKEDIATITISGSFILISGLSQQKQEKYQGNLGYWIDYQTTQEPYQKANLIICLHYLKQQQK